MRSRLLRLGSALPLALGGALWAAPVARAETPEEIVAQMQAEGFRSIEVSTTWLRRIRIVGEGQSGAREVVIDPRNGEVLRDFTAPATAGGRPGAAPPPPRPAAPQALTGRIPAAICAATLPAGRGHAGPGGSGGNGGPGGPGNGGPGGPGGREGPGGPAGPGGS
ncbi:hypothetical protein [Rhodobacter capsulatus]|uniref:hypothetical protein n=1 Tax=Rhodobacter capsulatus TaxID=1061 RepID=UPI00402579A0